MNQPGVLIADVIGSSGRKDLRPVLAKRLEAATRAHLKRYIRLPYAVTAGDEFQSIVAEKANIPELIFDLRVRMRPLELRIGIGFGEIPERIQQPVNRMGGEAFQRARRALEGIKEGSAKFEVLTAFQSGDELFDSTANVIYALQDTLLLKITNKQWDTIGIFRAKRRVGAVARILKLNASTVSRNLRRGYFWQMERTIGGMDRLIRETFFKGKE
jgi:SatD family (SatD)